MAFIKIDNEYTRTPEFLELASTPAFGIWFFLTGQIVREKGGAPGARRIYYKYFMAEKWLCSSYSVENIATYFKKFHKGGKPNKSWVSRHTKTLEKLGILKKRKDGRKIIYQLGYYTGTKNESNYKEAAFFDEYFKPLSRKAKEGRHIEREQIRESTMHNHFKEQLQLLQQ